MLVNAVGPLAVVGFATPVRPAVEITAVHRAHTGLPRRLGGPGHPHHRGASDDGAKASSPQFVNSVNNLNSLHSRQLRFSSSSSGCALSSCSYTSSSQPNGSGSSTVRTDPPVHHDPSEFAIPTIAHQASTEVLCQAGIPQPTHSLSQRPPYLGSIPLSGQFLFPLASSRYGLSHHRGQAGVRVTPFPRQG